MNSTTEDSFTSSSEGEEEDLELPETDADESIVVRPRQKGRRRVVSSSEEEDDDRLILSPRTRRSIGMPRIASPYSDSESVEILTDEEEEENGVKVEADQQEGDEEETALEKEETDQEEVEEEESDQEEADEEEQQIEEEEEEEEVKDPISPDSFENGISSKLSSTRYSGFMATKPLDPLNLDKVEEMLEKLDISRESDIVVIESDDSKDETKKIHISQGAMDFEKQKLDELLASQNKTEDLYKRMYSTLPDKGAQLLKKSESIKGQIAEQIRRMDGFVVKPEELKQEEEGAVGGVFLVDEGAVGGVEVPVKSERAQKRFMNQEKVTIETITNIHKTLNACPPEDMLMEQPEGLKVQLMDHQRYALTFMTWREGNKPKGGILADDMGTGKTLTMISLILLDKARRSEDEDDSPKWKNKDARNMYHGGTLIVCPASLLQQWTNEVQTKCKARAIQGYEHHGPNREDKARRLAKYDIVLTTYNTLASEERNRGPLFGVNWHRVVLDEGHVIRNHKTAMSRACCELEARNRWILTGTPLQNRIKDLYAPIKFLKCAPFDDVQYWNACIGDKKCHDSGQRRVHTILKLLMLRRTKAQLQEKGILEALPGKRIEMVQVSRTQDENALYNKFLLYSQSLFAQYLSQRSEMSTQDHKFIAKTQRIFREIKAKMNEGEISTTTIFTLILRLRQICCHPGLIKMNQPEDQDTDVSNDNDDSYRAMNLVELLDRLDLNSSDSNIAPESGVNTKYSRDIYDVHKPSSKITAAINLMREIRDAGEKMVVVSQWTSVLDILALHLDKENFRYLTLSGKTKISDRGEIVRNFNDPEHETQVLLLSLGAGGVGLNLVGGNNLLILDPHWNPQLELQAQDRVYRIGQRKAVKIYKFITTDSMEERVLSLQAEKLQMAETVLTGVKKMAGTGLSIKDLRTLFDM